ncbi:hypothetical protein JGH11_05480 [Dysgonomonas sp. Marseille-P4677]|uniref:hypothetical protein n=1 Tax=Dysgonomonas sp. Marseille-P4677 TaxID=2364790 RepID=UPI001913B612|nr:hypothetical protein [Dysgonomonas sp. Marseille-P4677]MBK5720315.1 hypothetical protein [Dysgonomonas sp. Marseille-P4677]
MIHYFNPGHETAVKNASPYYTAPANIVTMQRELSFLPAWYSKQVDLVLVSSLDNYEYFNYLNNIFPALPKPISNIDMESQQGSDISLWGISPQAIYIFRELCHKYDLKLNIPEWKDEYTYLNSRNAARDCLNKLTDEISDISKDIIPHFFTNVEDIEKAVDDSPYKVLSKAPYSSSGRGLLWLPESGLTRTERQILHGTLKKQGSVSLERALNKQIDFAMEFLSDGKGNVTFAGYSLFYTNSKGGYEANYIGTQSSIEKILTTKISADLLSEVKESLIKILQEKYATLYKGCIGVDMMIYKETETYRLHPCLEINMRYNMGYLAIKIFENYISETSQGKFYIDFSAKEGIIEKKHIEMLEKYPIIFDKEKISKGYLSLCPIDKKNHYRAYILIEEN